jgi:cytochrome P450 family 110
MLPPGSKAPALVQFIRWMRSPARETEALGARYGDAFTVKSPLFGDIACFSHPDAVKEIFTGDPAVFHAGDASAAFEFFLGPESVLVLDRAPHLHVRRLMLPAFHGERMLHYTAAIHDATHREVAKLTPGTRLALHPLFQRITLNVILRAVLGLDDGPALEAVRGPMVETLRLVLSPWGMIWSKPSLRKDLGPLTPWAAIRRSIDAVDQVLLGHIAAHRRGEGDPGDVLTMLVQAVDEEGKGFDDRAIRDQIVTLLLAGHETSATSLSWTFEEILRAPGEQDRLLAEAAGVLGGSPVTSEHLPRLERVDSVVKESLRLHPVTGTAARVLKAPAKVGGYDLPAGVMIGVMLNLLHRRPDLYPDPEHFQGDRFIGKKLDPYTWAPFGGGIRRCLGMAFALHEMKVMLATISGMGLRLSLERPGPVEETLRGSVFAPKGGTRVLVEAIRPTSG